ncbi:hypothetical protein ACLB2K_058785 [Fragaria x ananassa]
MVSTFVFSPAFSQVEIEGDAKNVFKALDAAEEDLVQMEAWWRKQSFLSVIFSSVLGDMFLEIAIRQPVVFKTLGHLSLTHSPPASFRSGEDLSAPPLLSLNPITPGL